MTELTPEEINQIEKEWDEYAQEFGETEYMDIDKHTKQAFRVPGLLLEIKRLRENLQNIHQEALSGLEDEAEPALEVIRNQTEGF